MESIDRRQFIGIATTVVVGAGLALSRWRKVYAITAKKGDKSMINAVCIAHRGASGKGHAPENTLVAFQKAIQMGVDAVECDVHCTKDDHIVVIHDKELKRTTNMDGVVSEMTLGEIKKADAGSWFDAKFAREPIPTLKEFLQITKGKVIAVVEIKQEDIADKVIKDIEETDSVGESIIISFHPSALRDAQRINPHIPRALLIGGGTPISKLSSILDLIHRAAEVGAGTLNLSRKIITHQLVKEAHLRGISVWAWTVDDEEEIKKLLEMGVTGITSNYPERVL
jgi:glycerophosphoryl diester phosphodiesterase